MQRNEHTKRYEVRRSTAGLGLFALTDFKKGERIIEYTGERISEDEANRRGGQYLFVVTDELVIDGKGRTNTARYINHSCRPNAEAEHDEDEDRIYINARRKIRAGEEVHYDYGKDFFTRIIKPKGCRCDKCSEKVKSASKRPASKRK